MELLKTKRLLQGMVENNRFDSYAVYVCKGDQEREFYSEGLNKNTFFDIASMGKVLVTSTLLLKAIGANKLSLEDTLSMFFGYIPNDKKEITLLQLLTHTSGIVKRKNLSAEAVAQGQEGIVKEICSQALAFPPSTSYEYSCMGYILLGFIIEKVYKMPLNEAYQKFVQEPLGLDGCVFNLSPDEPNRVVSYYTAERVGCLVADENCSQMEGVAGNGCSFWTMSGLKRYAKEIMNKNGNLYPKELFALAERDYTPNFAEGRGLGWLITDHRYAQTGKLFPQGSFGHCGNTGTSFFFNRGLNLTVILCTNATRFAWKRRNFTCPNYQELYGETIKMRIDVHNAIYEDLKSL